MKTEVARIIGILARPITATILAFIGICGSVHLKSSNIISDELTLISLISLSVLVGIVIFLSDRLELVSLIKFEIKLRQVEKIRQDVIAREENIKKIALIICEITAFESSIRGFGVSEKANKIRKKWYKSKTIQLLDAVKASSDEKEKSLKTLGLFSKIYPKGNFDEEKVNAGWKTFWTYIESDIKNTSDDEKIT